MPGIIPPPDLVRREVRRSLKIQLFYITFLQLLMAAVLIKGKLWV